MKALIFAAGLGTRLGSITKRMPKALVPVAGVPMLERVLGKLQGAGFSEAVINVCYKAEMIQDWLRDNPFPGMEIKLSVEPGGEPLETGGGLRHARGLLTGGPVLLHNVDILSNLDLNWFASKCGASPLASLLVTAPRAEDDRFFLFNPGDMRLAGWTNRRTGEVRGAIRGVPGAPEDAPSAEECRRMSFCGIHIVSQDIFPLLESWPEKFSITDFYIKEAGRHPIYGIPAPADFKMTDIGSPETLSEAGRALAGGAYSTR